MNDTCEPLIVTIDGPAGSGKSTVSSALARRLNLPCLNSGAIYRTVTLAVMEGGGRFDDREAVERTISGVKLEAREKDGETTFFLEGRDVTTRIKDPDVTVQVHRIANDGEYRKLLVPLQRDAVGGCGIVAEGRDMGTVIFPNARVKVFLDAPLEVRSRRQHRELLDRGVEATFEEVLEKNRERDRHDTTRADAPLRAANDAMVIDSGVLSVDEVLDLITSHFRDVFEPPSGKRETTA